MASWLSVVTELLEANAANWVNFGKIPTLIEEGFSNKSPAPDEGVMLNEESSDPIQSSKGEVLFEEQSGILTPYSTNRANRDDMIQDILNIFGNSNIPNDITDLDRDTAEIGKYNAEITVNILEDVETIEISPLVSGKTLICPFTVTTSGGTVLFRIACATPTPGDNQVLTWDTANERANWEPNTTTDELVKVSSNDSVADYLINKIIAGSTKIAIVEVGDGGDEDLSIDAVEANIDHDALLNFTINEHFTEASISHLNIQNIGSNSHVQVDAHIADNTIHFLSRIEQATEPIINNDENVLWWDTISSELWLLHKRSGTQYKVELT